MPNKDVFGLFKSDACKDAVISGSSASVLSALAAAVGGSVEEGSAAGPLNGPSQWLWGEAEAYTRRATVKHTLTGYLIHHAMSILWATAYEHAFGRCRARKVTQLSTRRIIGEAAVTAIVAYVVDYHVTPRRLRPGFEKHLSPRFMFATYVGFMAGLAATTLVRKFQSDRAQLPRRRRRSANDQFGS